MAESKTEVKAGTLCDLHNNSAGFLVLPKNGIWRLRDLYDVMIACQEIPCLQGVSPLPVSEGGFQWKATEESDALMKRFYSTTGSSTRQIRTIGVDFRLIEETENDWKEKMPKREDFDTPIGFWDSKEFVCRAKYYPSLEMIANLGCVFGSLGHRVQPEGILTRELMKKLKQEAKSSADEKKQEGLEWYLFKQITVKEKREVLEAEDLLTKKVQEALLILKESMLSNADQNLYDKADTITDEIFEKEDIGKYEKYGIRDTAVRETFYLRLVEHYKS
jgi:hypothetical protein